MAVRTYVDLRSGRAGHFDESMAAKYPQLEELAPQGISDGGDATLSAGVDIIFDSNVGAADV